MQAMVDPAHIDAVEALKILGQGGDGGSDMSDAGIVDKDVESRKCGKGGFHGARIRDIRGENPDTTPSPSRKGCRFLPCFNGEFQNMHISPLRSETQGHSPTDA